MTPQEILANLKRRGLIMTKNHDGSYTDQHGTLYPQFLFDEKRAGLDHIWATRLDDPYRLPVAIPHDDAFERVKAGYKLPGESATSVTVDLAKNSLKVASIGASQVVEGLIMVRASQVVEGLTTIAKAPVYIILGGTIGFFRYLWLDRKN